MPSRNWRPSSLDRMAFRSRVEAICAVLREKFGNTIPAEAVAFAGEASLKDETPGYLAVVVACGGTSDLKLRPLGHFNHRLWRYPSAIKEKPPAFIWKLALHALCEAIADEFMAQGAISNHTGYKLERVWFEFRES